MGDSALIFRVLCWVEEPVMRGQCIDALNTRVYKRLADAGRLIGIQLLDSLVVVDGGGFHSMREAEPDLFE